MLSNGSILMTSEIDSATNSWAILTPNPSGSYINGTWTRAANADYTRLFDSTDVVPNGDVLVAGGEYGTGTATGELYNPTTNTWTEFPGQNYGNFDDSWSMVVTGGTLNGDVLITPVGPTQSGYTTVFNPTTLAWSQGPKLFRGNSADEQNMVKLADDSILTIDGETTSERYIPSLNQWVNDGAVPESTIDTEGEHQCRHIEQWPGDLFWRDA